MTLHVYDKVAQGTPEWDDLRRGIITASTVSRFVTAKTLQTSNNPESRSVTALLVAERITGHTDPTYVGEDMMRGWAEETHAADAYSKHHAPVTHTGFMRRDEDGWTLGYSPDGLVGDDGLIEIKSRRQKKHLQTVLADQVPAENVAQCQAALLVSGRKWIDYVSFCGGMALYVKRVYPDPKWQAAIKAAVRQFEITAAEMTSDYLTRTANLPATERVTLDNLGLVF